MKNNDHLYLVSTTRVGQHMGMQLKQHIGSTIGPPSGSLDDTDLYTPIGKLEKTKATHVTKPFVSTTYEAERVHIWSSMEVL